MTEYICYQTHKWGARKVNPVKCPKCSTEKIFPLNNLRNKHFGISAIEDGQTFNSYVHGWALDYAIQQTKLIHPKKKVTIIFPEDTNNYHESIIVKIPFAERDVLTENIPSHESWRSVDDYRIDVPIIEGSPRDEGWNWAWYQISYSYINKSIRAHNTARYKHQIDQFDLYEIRYSWATKDQIVGKLKDIGFNIEILQHFIHLPEGKRNDIKVFIDIDNYDSNEILD